MRNFHRLCFIFAGWLLALAPFAAMALPTVGSTLTRTSDETLVLTFSESVGSTSGLALLAITPSSYTLDGTDASFQGVTPNDPSLDISGRSVTLTVPNMASLPHGSTVTVTVANTVADVPRSATYTVDAVPSSFSFSSISNALLATAYESAPITVSDINTTLTVATTAGSNASLKCAALTVGSTTWGAFGACSSVTVSNGDQLKLQLTSASDYSTTVSGGIFLAGVSAIYSVTTESAPILPTVGSTLTRTSATTLVLTFSGAPSSAANTVTNYTLSGTSGFSGNPSAASIDISGTSVSLTVPTMATLPHGATVVVTVDNTVVNAAANRVATYTIDATPTLSPIPSNINNAQFSTAYESLPFTVSDINTSLTVGTTSGSNASLKCAALPAGSTTWGAFGACSSITVSNGDQLKLQLTSASAYSTTVSGGIILAGVSASFSVTTANAPVGLLPTVASTLIKTSATTLILSFSKALGSAASTTTNYTLSGTSGFSGNPSAVSADISGTSVTLTVPTMATLSHGQTVVVTVANTLADATRNIATYTVDAVPLPFSFSSINNARTATVYETEPITINDINTTLTVATTSGSNSTLKCAALIAGSTTWGAFGVCSSVTVSNGDQLKLQLSSASSHSTTVSGEVVLAGVSASFSVTTYSAEASAPIPIPSNVSIAPLTSLTSSLRAPPSSLYISSNDVIVVPPLVSQTLTVLPTAAEKTAFSIQSGAFVSFALGGSRLSIEVTGQEAALLVLTKFNVDNYSNLQTLELAKGSIRVSQSSGTAPIISLQLGTGTTPVQVAVMHAGSPASTFSALINDDTSVKIAVTSGKVALRRASATSTVALTDSSSAVFQDEVADLSTAGAVSSIRIGSLDGNGTGVGDAMTFASTSSQSSDIDRKAKIPRLNASLARLGKTGTLLDMLFDTAGLRSNLANGGQTDQGIVPLLIDSVRYYFTPVGDVTVDKLRSNGVRLTKDGLFEITHSGVMARFRPSIFNTAGFATSLSSSIGATVKLNTAGALEVSKGGTTLLMMPELFAQTTSTGTTGVTYFDGDGVLGYAENGLVQRLLPTLYDINQFSSAFSSFADRVDLQDNLNGTYAASLIDVADDGKTEEVISSFTVVPAYQILSPVVVQNTHLNDPWWQGDDGLIYIKYSNGSAQGFSTY